MQKSIPYKTLLIVESPSKCKTIEDILGINYMCVATCGHIRELSIEDDLSNIPQILKSQNIPYIKSSKKMGQIRMIQAAFAKCNGEVIFATDADREGESIAWHVCELLQLSVQTTPRIIFKEITATAIQNAIKNPTKINMNLVRAQQARQVIDFIIGYGVTPILWNALKQSPQVKTNAPKKIVQSAGRCQTPALRIMYDVYCKMQNTMIRPNFKYKCIGEFTKYNIPFTLTKKMATDDVDAFLHIYTDSDTRHEVASLHIFEICPIQTVSYKAPLPLKTTTLQQIGNSYIKLTPIETMAIAQNLYEKGYITYHRTNSTILSSEFKTQAVGFIRTNWNDSYVSTHSTTPLHNNISYDYAHEAIRPVNILLTKLPETHFSKNEQLLYTFIWVRAVCSCMRDSIYEMIRSTITFKGDLDEYIYQYCAYRQKISGWRACVARYGMKTIQAQQSYTDKNDHGENHDPHDPYENPDSVSAINFQSPQYSSDHFTYLQSIVPGTKLPYNTLHCIPVVTNKFTSYTYTTLINQLEKIGIGRPSTFASIVHTLKKREYIQTESPHVEVDEQLKDTPYKEYTITYGGSSQFLTEITTTVSNGSSLSLSSSHNNKHNIYISPTGQAVISALFP